MKKINTLTALIFILGTLRIFSQDIDTSNFFPYKTGDMWEYFFDAGGPDIDTVQTITVSDSTNQEGKIHITQISRHINPIHTVHLFNYIIDTVNNYVYGMSGVGTSNQIASFYVLLFPAFWHKSYPFPHTFIKGKICYIFRQTVCLFRLYS